jgi:hypothetical protein
VVVKSVAVAAVLAVSAQEQDCLLPQVPITPLLLALAALAAQQMMARAAIIPYSVLLLQPVAAVVLVETEMA